MFLHEVLLLSALLLTSVRPAPVFKSGCFVVGFAPGLSRVGAEEGEVGVRVRQGL